MPIPTHEIRTQHNQAITVRSASLYKGCRVTWTKACTCLYDTSSLEASRTKPRRCTDPNVELAARKFGDPSCPAKPPGAHTRANSPRLRVNAPNAPTHLARDAKMRNACCARGGYEDLHRGARGRRVGC